MDSSKKRIGYIDALRGFTMLIVVFVHIQLFCYGEFTTPKSLPVSGAFINLLIYRDLFLTFLMPLFFFISGFVLYKPGVKWSIVDCFKFVRKKGLLLLLPTTVFIILYIVIFDAPLYLLCQSGRLGYWFTIALFEFYILYAIYRCLCKLCNCNEGIDWLLVIGSAALYFVVTQSVLSRLGVSNETISLLGLDQLRFFFYFAIGTLAMKHFDDVKKYLENGKIIGLSLIVFFSLFMLVHRVGFEFVNAIMYHLYNFFVGILSLFLVFVFFYKYRSTFDDTNKLGSVLQYIGQHTLAIYMLHYFFLPRNLQFIGDFFVLYPNPTIELFVTTCITILVIAISLIANALICTSPILAHYLYWSKNE